MKKQTTLMSVDLQEEFLDHQNQQLDFLLQEINAENQSVCLSSGVFISQGTSVATALETKLSNFVSLIVRSVQRTIVMQLKVLFLTRVIELSGQSVEPVTCFDQLGNVIRQELESHFLPLMKLLQSCPNLGEPVSFQASKWEAQCCLNALGQTIRQYETTPKPFTTPLSLEAARIHLEIFDAEQVQRLEMAKQRYRQIHQWLETHVKKFIQDMKQLLQIVRQTLKQIPVVTNMPTQTDAMRLDPHKVNSCIELLPTHSDIRFYFQRCGLTMPVSLMTLIDNQQFITQIRVCKQIIIQAHVHLEKYVESMQIERKFTEFPALVILKLPQLQMPQQYKEQLDVTLSTLKTFYDVEFLSAVLVGQRQIMQFYQSLWSQNFSAQLVWSPVQ